MEEWSVSPKDAAKAVGVVIGLVVLAIAALAFLFWSVPAAFHMIYN